MTFINDYIGCAFKSGGRGPDTFDCWGLVHKLFERYGHPIPDYNISVAAAQAIDLEVERQTATPVWKKLTAPQIPCVVVIQCHPVYVQHFGFMFTADKFVHVLVDKFVCVDSISSPLWEKRIRGFYQYVGRAAAAISYTPSS